MAKGRVVITGGAGFIGSHLCEELIRRDYDVTCIDNLLTGDLANIQPLFGNPKFMFMKMDVTNFIHVPGEVNYILHFASPASPVDYLRHPIPTLKVGALGTHKALGLAKEKRATFFLASTSEIYGDPLVHPQPESYWGNVNPIGPRGVYDEAKRFAEALSMAYHRNHKIDVKIVRIFNTYGPRMRREDGRAVPTFINEALAGQPMTIFGDGKQTRSFCFVTDLVDGILRLLFSDFNGPMNLGNPAEYSIMDLARMIAKLAGVPEKFRNQPLPVDDPKVRRPDISLATQKLGWSPRVPVEEGLKVTIDYFRKSASPSGRPIE
ncbi:MAG: SDR family oxidoreductase [Nitrospirae bacterium]|nr:SDR family oxidoreductase [Nitrospirota bacterium]